MSRRVALSIPLCLVLACGGADELTPEQQAIADVKIYIEQNMHALTEASEALQNAAPAPDDDGWNASADAAAVAAMKSEWKRAREAYESIEGAIAVLFPEIDVATDQRYDAFLTDNGADDDLFDDQNVTGVHGIERILWSNAIPAAVVDFESAVTGYSVAAFPSNRAQAEAFKNKLCARLVADVKNMHEQFEPLALDPATAYRGIIGSMEEQIEKAEKAATGEEESRYAQYTLADMRTNVAAGKATFQAFLPWLESKNAQEHISKITAAFARVDTAYAALSGDALPAVPASWSSLRPSASDLETPFGKLWSVLHAEADPGSEGSLVANMQASAQVLGIPELPE